MKILVVDDSSMMRRIISGELKQEGYEVIEAKNGVEAVEIAQRERPSLITMDVDMPEMNGYDAAREIRTRLKLRVPKDNKEVPIVFVTANDTIEGRKRGFKVGATDFIIKPFLKGEVAATVVDLLSTNKTFEGQTALVAEDSITTRSIIDNILKGEGVNTILAVNGKEAFEILKEREHQIDIVVTDYMMPEMDGDELCEKIRFELGNKSIPVLILSAMSESTSVLKMFKAGASDYLVKPFAKEELIARVKVHLESRRLYKKMFSQVHELKRLSKLKDDFISITSHDLRSPLNGILGFTDLLMQDETLSQQNKQYLSHVRDSGNFLLTLINDILDLGRAQSEEHELELEPVQIQRFIDASINTTRHMATPKEIDLILEKRCESSSYILGDKNALIRIFNNLLSNAIKFTPKKGTVQLVVEREDEDKLLVSIIDNGIGIPAEHIPHLFKKFSKASRTGTAGEKSTGLGMSITKELVERHSGTIEVESEEGKGTRFRVRFPLLNDNDFQKPCDQKKHEGHQGQLQGVRILVVDDNGLNIKLATTIFEKRGYIVTSAMDGKQALDYYKRSTKGSGNALDIIFMDLKMPVMDGFDSTRAIREFEIRNNLPHIPVVAMTAGIDDTWQTKAKETGLNGYVAKPISIDQVEDILKQFIRVDKDKSISEE